MACQNTIQLLVTVLASSPTVTLPVQAAAAGVYTMRVEFNGTYADYTLPAVAQGASFVAPVSAFNQNYTHEVQFLNGSGVVMNATCYLLQLCKPVVSTCPPDNNPLSPSVGCQKGDDGESAYEIWLEAGNTGTVQDFLDSLVGAPGNASAASTPFAPDVASNWNNAPTNVAEALDEEAERIKAVETALTTKADTREIYPISGSESLSLDKERLVIVNAGEDLSIDTDDPGTAPPNTLLTFYRADNTPYKVDVTGNVSGAPISLAPGQTIVIGKDWNGDWQVLQNFPALPRSTDEIGEGTTNLYFTDARAQAANAADIANAQNRATNAVATANSAATVASNADTKATNALAAANTANTTANTASTNASSAVTTANNAVNTANAAIPRPASPATGDLLQWNGSAWVKFTPNYATNTALAAKADLTGVVQNQSASAQSASYWINGSARVNTLRVDATTYANRAVFAGYAEIPFLTVPSANGAWCVNSSDNSRNLLVVNNNGTVMITERMLVGSGSYSMTSELALFIGQAGRTGVFVVPATNSGIAFSVCNAANNTNVIIMRGDGSADFNGAVKMSGAQFVRTATASATGYTVASTDYYIELPAISSAQTLTLPTASANAGRELLIVNTNTSANTWSFSSAVTNAAGATTTAIPNGSTIRLISNGTIWRQL